MNLLKKIFTDESTARIGLCRFKMSKVSIGQNSCNMRFATAPRNYFATDFSKNLLL